MKFKDLKRILEDAGFYIVRSKKHWIFSNGENSIPVPNHHARDINPILAKQILKQLERFTNATREV